MVEMRRHYYQLDSEEVAAKRSHGPCFPSIAFVNIVANPHHPTCVYHKFKDIPTWTGCAIATIIHAYLSSFAIPSPPVWPEDGQVIATILT